MSKLLWLGVLAGTLVTAPSWAQSDDNPYGEPTPPTHAAAPAQPKPPAAHPAAKPPAAHPAAPPAAPPAPAPAQPEQPAQPTAEPAAVPPPASAMPEQAEPAAKPAPPAAPPEPSAQEAAGAAQGEAQAHGEPAPAGEHAAAPEHGQGAHGQAEHAEGAHEGHNAPPTPMNWFYGFLGTDEKAEPSLLWRKPEMPPPFLANLINFAVFAYVIVRFGKKPLQEALAARKKTITQDIDAATRMKDEAAKRLAQYEDRLKHIDQEIERIKKDFREQGERDKERILADAKDKRERMLKDAQFMVEQEAKQLRLDLVHETVEAAIQAAEQILVQKVTSSDQDRVAEEFLKQVASSRGLGVSKGGRA